MTTFHMAAVMLLWPQANTTYAKYQSKQTWSLPHMVSTLVELCLWQLTSFEKSWVAHASECYSIATSGLRTALAVTLEAAGRGSRTHMHPAVSMLLILRS